jgi:hypothetical protein
VSSDPEEGYVHRPEALDADEEGGEPGEPDAPDATGETGEPGTTGTAVHSDADAETAPLPGPAPNGFGDRGWALVATVVLAFLVIPGVIYLRPALPGEAGVPFIVAMLILPLVPAVLLGLTAVWSMSASRRR